VATAWRVAVALTAMLMAGGCGGGATRASRSETTAGGAPRSPSSTAAGASSTAAGSTLAGLRLTSPAFGPGGAIPSRYTCDGADSVLPVRWSGVPSSVRELVLVMRDPDAPTANFVHWAVAGIRPAVAGIGAGPLPPGAVQGRNSFGTLGYRGPCPPRGGRPHQYVLTLSALSSSSRLKTGFSADQLRTAAVALGTLIGSYGRR